MEEILKTMMESVTAVGLRIIGALAVWFLGRFLIKKLIRHFQNSLSKTEKLADVDRTVSSFSLNLIETVLYIVLAITIVGILGIPMASVVTVLASAGVAVGLALQGALSNVAGGIMIMVFRPFGVGDYVEAGGAEGTVSRISLFYTVLTTPQNTEITVPNGTLMAANIINYTANDRRRIDAIFTVGKDTDLDQALRLMSNVFETNELILKEPAASASVTGQTDTAIQLSARAWTASSTFIAAKESMIRQISQAFADEGIPSPAVRIITEK